MVNIDRLTFDYLAFRAEKKLSCGKASTRITRTHFHIEPVNKTQIIFKAGLHIFPQALFVHHG